MTDPHPLFPERDGDLAPPEICTIHVSRYERGRMRFAPMKFGPGDLNDLTDIYEIFGGGVYELIAKDSRNRISRKERVEIAGPSRPLVPTDDESQTGIPAPAMPETSGARVTDYTRAGMSEPMLALMVQMMQQMHESNVNQQQANTQILVALLNRGQDSSKDYVQAMGSLQGQFMQALANAQGGGGGGVDAFLKGVEMAADIRAGAAEAAGGDDSTIRDIIQGVQMALQMQQTTPTAAVAPTGQSPAEIAARMQAQQRPAPAPAPAPAPSSGGADPLPSQPARPRAAGPPNIGPVANPANGGRHVPNI
jgi:hypothetical protein